VTNERRRGQPLPAKPEALWLRKATVAGRYGISERSVDRKAESGQLPKPRFPIGGSLPLWSREDLDAHDARARVTV
jgi:hypothetical protein